VYLHSIESGAVLPFWAIDLGQDQLLETKDGHPIRKASWQTV
jgi:hypothetical protein